MRGLSLRYSGSFWICLRRFPAAASFLCLAFLAALPAQSQTINTVAGNNTAGYTGDGMPATEAEIDLSAALDSGTGAGVGTDTMGNFYIGDSGNCVVRAVNTQATTMTILGVSIAPGDIQTVAGDGTSGCGYSGDTGPATNAQLRTPVGVALDATGNLYIADFGNCLVRKVTTTGVISTVAGSFVNDGDGFNSNCGYSGDGGQATSTTAELDRPVLIALDGAGDIFIPDVNNCLVRAVNTQATTVTIGGISVPSGDIQTVAGTATGAGTEANCGYAGDGAAATNAELSGPTGVTVDSSGNFYIADSFNCLIRKVSSGGTITSVAGTTAGAGTGSNCGYGGDGGLATNAELNNPTGVTLDSNHTLFIADSTNCLIRKVATGGGITTSAGATPSPTCSFSGDGGPAGLAKLSDPYAVATDSTGNYYIADVVNNVIRKVGPAPATTVTLATSPNPSYGDQELTLTATVTPAPTYSTGLGDVTFYANGVDLGVHGYLTSYDGVTSIAYYSLLPSVSPYSLTAVYSSPTLSNSVTSNTVMQTVDKQPTSTGLVISAPSMDTWGQSVTLTATAAASPNHGAVPTGTVSFKDGTVFLGNADLNTSGVAVLQTAELPAGTDGVTATYNGSVLMQSSSSAAMQQTVQQASSMTAVSALPASPSTGGETVSFTATVTPEFGGAVTGDVTFLNGSTPIGIVAVNSAGVAKLNYAALTAGMHIITAVYAGSTNLATSTSPLLPYTVNSDTTTTNLMNSPSTSSITQPVTLTATITTGNGVEATGTVSFFSGTTLLGNAALSGGKAALVHTFTAEGTYSLTAKYDGSVYKSGSMSNTVTQTVN
ncbi:MAG: Ig-like domain repeat protein [Terriglobales bacterium]